jgi:hypothetical protein
MPFHAINLRGRIVTRILRAAPALLTRIYDSRVTDGGIAIARNSGRPGDPKSKDREET